MGGLARRDAADRHRVRRRHAVARRHPVLRAASSRRRRSSARCWAGGLPVPFAHAGARRVPHGLLHVPRGVHRLLRRARRAAHGAPRRHGEPRPRRAADRWRCRSWILAAAVAMAHRHRASRSGIPRRSSRRRAGSRPLAVGGRARRASCSPGSTYQRRAISADAARRRLRARSATPALRALLARRRLRAGSTAACSSAFSRVVGWIDRYIVDGVLNVLSAWTLDGGRPAAAHPDRPPRTTSTASPRRPRAPRLVPVARVIDDGLARPLRHHLGALRRRRPHHVPARHRPLPRALARRRQHGRLASCSSICDLRGLRPRGGGLPVLRGARRWCRRSASSTSSASTA